MIPSPYPTALSGSKHSFPQLLGVVADVSQLSPSPGVENVPITVTHISFPGKAHVI